MGEVQQEDWEEILGRYKDMVYRIALTQTKQKADADDVFQETFLRLVKINPAFETEEHRKAWLIRVTLNCCKNLWHSSWKRRVVSLEECMEATVPMEEEKQDLLSLVRALPPKERIIIHLFYYEDFTLKEISAVLGISYSGAAKRLSRARKTLKSVLEGEEEYAELSRGLL